MTFLFSPRNLIIRIDTFCNINCQDDRSHTSISWRFAQLLTLSVTNHPLTGHFTSIWLVFLTCDWLAAFILEREIWKMTCHIGGCCCRKCQISLAGNKLFLKFQNLSSMAHHGLVCIVNPLLVGLQKWWLWQAGAIQWPLLKISQNEATEVCKESK